MVSISRRNESDRLSDSAANNLNALTAIRTLSFTHIACKLKTETYMDHKF